MFKASDGFGTVAGSYAVAAGYLSEQGCWLTIPPGEPGAVDEVGVTVIPPPRRDRIYRSRPAPAAPRRPGPPRPGPDDGDGPWTVEYAVEVTSLDA